MKISDNNIIYYKGFKKISVPVSDLVWGYLQLEDVKASMCCGSFNSVIGRVIFMDKDGNKHSYQHEGKEKASELLEAVASLNKDMAVGYTKENKERFGIA